MTYASLADVKAAIGVTDYTDDDRIEIALAAAEEAINAYCGRTFTAAGTATAVRLFVASDQTVVDIDDCTSITAIETDNGANNVWISWATTDWQAEPVNGLVGGRSVPYNCVRAIAFKAFPDVEKACVRITATWGWADVPAPVVTATRIMASRLYKRDDSPLGIAGGPDTGLLYLSRSIDPDVAFLLAPYRRGTAGFGVA